MSKKKVNTFFLISLQLIFICQSHAAEQNRWQVVDKHNGTGLESTIEKLTLDNTRLKVSITDKSGFALTDINCAVLEELIIVADDNTYYQEQIRCPVQSKKIALTAASYTKNFITNATKLYEQNEFGRAALAFNEAAYLVRRYEDDSALLIQLEKNAFISAGRQLAVSDSFVFDVKQNKDVMSPELRVAIEKFQSMNGLKAEGHLNFPTVEKLSLSVAW
jgi:hypothetical protein